MDGGMVGRDAVLGEAWRALAVPAAVVLLDGPAGIGKTVLWRALRARAEQAGWLVLSCAPAESEAALPFAALADLLRPLAHRVPDLPGPQRLAAEVALLAAESAQQVDERAIGAATRSLLDAAAGGDRRVLVAVDDAPWLDPPSERALRFALRRAAAPLAALIACRTGAGTEPLGWAVGGTEPPGRIPPGTAQAEVPLGLDRRPHGGQVARFGLGPLGVGALHHVLRTRLGATLSRPLLARIARDAGGNPLYAIELARAVLRLPRPPLPGEDLPVAASMQHLLVDALSALPAESRDAVRMAALLAVPALRDLAAAGVPAGAFDPAEEAGLLAVGPVAVEFAHPVYAAAVRASIPPGVRRRLHHRLAGVAADPDERARQLAACTVGPDATVAGELATAADRQRTRGAPQVAAQLYERAAELTPADAGADRGRRRLAAVRCRFDSGEYAAAGAAAEQVAAEFAEEAGGEVRAEALLIRAEVAWCADDIAGAVAAAERGLAAAPAGTRMAGLIHAYLTLFEEAPRAALHHAEAALELLGGGWQPGDGTAAGWPGGDADRGLLSAVLMHIFFHEVRAGRPARTALLDRALALEAGEPSRLASTVPVIWWNAIDEPDRARDRLQWMLRRAVLLGDEPSQHELLTHLGDTELRACRWSAAAGHIAAARELGEQLGTGLAGETYLAGMLAAYQGDLTTAGGIAEAGLRRAEQLDDPWCRRIHQNLAGLVAISAARWDGAAAAYGALASTVDAVGLVEPLSQRFEADWIEACVGTGDLVSARGALDRLAERDARLPRPWTTLGLARSRALLASAAGADPAGTLDGLTAARAAVPPAVLPLERARCLLVAGMVHRRARRKRDAREALTAAVAEFDAMGAAAFAGRARAELARVGFRPPAQRDLTATEERIARLAAQGRTNRVIADALFVSPKTVEANLARVYRKLGISGRAELGVVLAGRVSG